MAFVVCFTKKFEVLLSYERVSIAKPLTEDAPAGKGKEVCAIVERHSVQF